MTSTRAFISGRRIIYIDIDSTLFNEDPSLINKAYGPINTAVRNWNSQASCYYLSSPTSRGHKTDIVVEQTSLSTSCGAENDVWEYAFSPGITDISSRSAMTTPCCRPSAPRGRNNSAAQALKNSPGNAGRRFLPGARSSRCIRCRAR
jgi:hypothetical protein